MNLFVPIHFVPRVIFFILSSESCGLIKTPQPAVNVFIAVAEVPLVNEVNMIFNAALARNRITHTLSETLSV